MREHLIFHRVQGGRKVLCTFQTNIIALVFPQPKQTFQLASLFRSTCDDYIYLIASQAEFCKFIHSANQYLWSVMLFKPSDRQQECRGDWGKSLPPEGERRVRGIQLQSVLPCEESSYPAWMVQGGCLKRHLNSNTKMRKSFPGRR